MYHSVGMHCLMKVVIQESDARIWAICHSQRVFTGELSVHLQSECRLRQAPPQCWTCSDLDRQVPALSGSCVDAAEQHYAGVPAFQQIDVSCIHLYPVLFVCTGDFWILSLLSYLKHLMPNWKTFLKFSTFLRVNYWVSLVVLPPNSIYLQFPAF